MTQRTKQTKTHLHLHATRLVEDLARLILQLDSQAATVEEVARVPRTQLHDRRHFRLDLRAYERHLLNVRILAALLLRQPPPFVQLLQRVDVARVDCNPAARTKGRGGGGGGGGEGSAAAPGDA